MTDFVGLHTHSEHSHLDGLSKVWDKKTKKSSLMERVVELNQYAIALTDHGVVEGHLRFQKAADKYNIKPIFGMEGYAADNRHIREGKKGEKYEHMTVLAKNKKGLENLWALSSQAWLDGLHYGDPRFDWELLEQYSEGLIVTGGCLGGFVASCFNEAGKKYNEDIGIQRLSRLLGIFGEDFYLEIHTFEDPEARKTNERLIDLAYEFSIPLIACNDAHYLRGEDWEKHEVMVASQMRKAYDDPSRYTYGEAQLHLHSVDDVRKKLNYLDSDIVDEAIKNTKLVADSCGATVQGSTKMPTFYKDEKTDIQKLRKLAEERFAEKIERRNLSAEEQQMWRERLDYELDVICKQGFAGYFLIVSDIIEWSKKHMLPGPGRGSVNGSLLAYILGIIALDPFRGELLFERFIDPQRKALPDIDMDFPQQERDMVKKYVEEKWEYVAGLGTFSVLAPLSLLNDMCKVLKVPFADKNAIAKIVKDNLVKGEKDVTFQKVYSRAPDAFAPWKDKYPFLFEMMLELSNHIRQAGGHASAVVLSKESFMGKLPLRRLKKDEEARTQFDMHDVEELGFVKFDFLGLRNLSTLMKARELVLERGIDLPDFWDWEYEWDKYYNDPKVYKSLQQGFNTGVFQLDTASMKDFAPKFKPESFEDVCTMISVYRPGITRAIDPETNIPQLDLLIAKRNGEREVTYKHPILESLLSKTYGNVVYQEQTMRILEAVAGYPLSTSYDIVKLISKSKAEEVSAERKRFIHGDDTVTGAVKNGISREIADNIFGDLERTGEYQFNKGHGWAYSAIALWTAFMKFYYPREYMSALLETNPKKTASYIRECRRLGIEVAGPDISASKENFTLGEDGVIRCGLSKVKWVGSTAKAIIENAPYATIEDFLTKLGKKADKRASVNLIRVGALDSLITKDVREDFYAEYDVDLGTAPESWSDAKIALYKFWEIKGHKEWRDMWRGLTEQPKDGKRDTIPEESPHWINAECIVKSKYRGMSNFEAYCDIIAAEDRGAAELELLDTPITVDPFEEHLDLILANETFTSEQDMRVNQIKTMGGIIRKIKPLVTKKGKNPGQEMCQMFIERPMVIEDDDEEETKAVGGEWEQLVVFPDTFKRYKTKLKEGAVVLAKVEKLESGMSLRQMYDLREV